MRVIILEQSATPLPDEEIERAWHLVAALGRCEANRLIIDRLGETPPGRSDIVDGWVALARGIDTLAHATRH